MALHTTKLFQYTFDTGTGTKTITQDLDKFDLSLAKALICRLFVTKADTDAGDILDVYIEERSNIVSWDPRGRFAQVLGDLSPSVSAPEELKLVISADVNLDTTEEAYEPSSPLGPALLLPGTVRNGPFAGKLYSGGLRVATHRVRLEVTEASTANADFEGNVTIEAVTEV